MTRTPLVVGNWKMLLSHKGATETVRAIKKGFKDLPLTIDVVVCPSYPALPEAAKLLAKNSKLQLGAQNVSHLERGALTGEVAIVQLKPFISWCIIGHSEARAIRGESDEIVAVKAELLLKHGITPVVCLGETLDERRAEQTIQKVTSQMNTLLERMNRVAISKLVITYEPIWAISANEPVELPDPSDVASTMLLMRKLVAERFGYETADRLRLLYGGSVTADNAAAFVSEPSVDGVLVGSASTRPMQFLAIVKAVQASADSG